VRNVRAAVHEQRSSASSVNVTVTRLPFSPLASLKLIGDALRDALCHGGRGHRSSLKSTGMFDARQEVQQVVEVFETQLLTVREVDESDLAVRGRVLEQHDERQPAPVLTGMGWLGCHTRSISAWCHSAVSAAWGRRGGAFRRGMGGRRERGVGKKSFHARSGAGFGAARITGPGGTPFRRPSLAVARGSTRGVMAAVACDAPRRPGTALVVIA